jgi:hypothetical protein
LYFIKIKNLCIKTNYQVERIHRKENVYKLY